VGKRGAPCGFVKGTAGKAMLAVEAWLVTIFRSRRGA
jgi:hypothetical protein